MHRLAHFKLKKKPMRESNRSVAHESAAIQFNLPVLELSLSESKSFRASVILPDLSRRFTLLRTNGELLPLDNFCDHVRHELETGHITEEDENILIHQYQQQYLSETPSFLRPPSSPSETNIAPVSPSSSPSKISSGAATLSAARDVEYNNNYNTIGMFGNRKKVDATQTNWQAAHVVTEQFYAATLDDISQNSFMSSSIGAQLIAQPRQVIQKSQTDSTTEDWEDNASIELTQAQIQRLSLAVDRILGTHQAENSTASYLKPESVALQEDPDHLSNSLCSVSTPFGAESRVQQELSMALPDESSVAIFPVPSPWLVHDQANTVTSHENPSCVKHSLQEGHHCSQQKHQKDNSGFESVSFDEYLSGFSSDDLEFLPENSFENESSVFEFEQFDFDNLPQPVTTLDRDHPFLPADWTYNDVLFIQSALCSCQSNSLHQQLPASVDWSYSDALFIQSALCSPDSDQPACFKSSPHSDQPPCSKSSPHSDQPPCSKTEDQLERNFSLPACPTSVDGSRDVTPRIISPRSSSLQHRLNLSKNSAMASGRKTTALHQASNIQSPTETSFGGPPSFHQILSPSSVDSLDASSFPLTPPLVARSSLVGQAYIPSSPKDSYSSPNENHQARPRGFNSRAGRPIPTTILFRDVAAQVVAANAALRNASSVQTNGSSNRKKLHSRQKYISTAQVGAPVLLSASAKLSELELEKTYLGRSTSHTDTNKDMSKKSGFKLKLRKTRPSESRSSYEKNDITLATTHHDSSRLVQVDESTPTAAPTSAAFSRARDSINASTNQNNKHRSADPPESHASWKHSQALTSRVRRLIGRQRKLSSNPASVAKNPDPISSIGSIDTSSEEVPHLQTSDDFQQLGLEIDTPNIWPPSASKSLPRRSQSFHDLGFSSSDTPSRDSEMDDHRDRNSLFVSVSSTEPSYPDQNKSDTRHSLAETRSFPASVSNNLSGIRPCYTQNDGATVQSDSTKDNSHGVDLVITTADQSKSQITSTAHTLAVPSPWFESQGYAPHSDYASSILDLYGCDSQSTTGSSPKRSSSASRYSNPCDLSRPISGLFPSNRIQHPQRRPNGLHIDDHNENIVSSNELQLPTSNIPPRERSTTQNELMVMVQQLQNSTRYSEYEPTRSSFNPKEASSAASFIQHIVQGNPDGNSFKMTHANSRAENSDDDDEAEVWKQILKG